MFRLLVMFLLTGLFTTGCVCAQEPITFFSSIEAARESSDGKTVVLYFGAAWCKPCQQMKAITFKSQKLAEETENFQFIMFDVDRDVELATRYQVAGVPSMIVLDAKNLSPIGGTAGFLSDERLIQFLNDTVAHPAKLPPTIEMLVTDLGDADFDVAHTALEQIMEQLADSQRSDRKRLVEILTQQNDEIVNQLIVRLEDPRLSIRAAASTVLEYRLGRQIEFDPFANAEQRADQVDALMESLDAKASKSRSY